MSLISLFLANGKSGFGYGSTAEQVSEGISLIGKTMLVTGCNSGLGLETMRVLALRGATVIGSARSIEKAQGALIRRHLNVVYGLEARQKCKWQNFFV